MVSSARAKTKDTFIESYLSGGVIDKSISRAVGESPQN